MEFVLWDPFFHHDDIDVFPLSHGIHLHLAQVILPPILLLDVPDVSVSEFEPASVDVDSFNIHTLVSTLNFVGATADVEVPRPKAKQRRHQQPTGPLRRSPRLATKKLEPPRPKAK
jgi:hypothetical protein